MLSLREQLRAMRERYADSATVMPQAHSFDFITGHVINNSVMRPYNYVTVNKGSANGVAPEMGVIDQNGAEIYRVEESARRMLTAYGHEEAEVFAIRDGKWTLCALMQQTIMAMHGKKERAA